MAEPVRCGVIGLGLMGSVHANILNGMGRADLAVCCDIDPAAAERCPEGARFTDDYHDLLSEPGLKAVFVATPEHLHREPVVAALEAGLHVFCEKPIAATLEDADTMIAAEKATGRLLVIGHVLRFDPRYAHVHEAVASGTLGQAIHTVTRRSSSYAEGRNLVGRTTLPLYLSIHDIDALQWILGARITRIQAETSSFRMADVDSHDTVGALFRFDDGSVSLHETSWALPDQAGLAFGDYYFSYVGTRGCAYIELRDQNIVVFGGTEPDESDSQPAWASGGGGTFSYPEMTYMPEVMGIPSGIYMAQLDHFLLAATDGRSPAITTEEAHSALVATLALEQAASTGLPVDVT